MPDLHRRGPGRPPKSETGEVLAARFSARITPAEFADLDHRRAVTGLSVADLVRRFLDANDFESALDRSGVQRLRDAGSTINAIVAVLRGRQVSEGCADEIYRTLRDHYLAAEALVATSDRPRPPSATKQSRTSWLHVRLTERDAYRLRGFAAQHAVLPTDLLREIVASRDSLAVRSAITAAAELARQRGLVKLATSICSARTRSPVHVRCLGHLKRAAQAWDALLAHRAAPMRAAA